MGRWHGICKESWDAVWRLWSWLPLWVPCYRNALSPKLVVMETKLGSLETLVHSVGCLPSLPQCRHIALDSFYFSIFIGVYLMCNAVFNFRCTAKWISFIYIYQFSSIQSLSHVRLFVTPWITARQASLSITNSQSLLKLKSIELVMPSSHLILCRPSKW